MSPFAGQRRLRRPAVGDIFIESKRGHFHGVATNVESTLSKLFRNVLIRTQEKMSPLLMVLSACPRRLFERAGGRRRRLLSHSSRRRRSPRRNGPAPPARIGAPGISELCCPFLWQCLRPAAAA